MDTPPIPEKTPVGKCLRELRHLGERQRENGRTAQTASGHQPVDVDFELHRLRIDQGQRREGVGRGNRVRAAEERPAGFDDDVVVDGVSLAQTGMRATSLTTFVTIEHEFLVLADVRPHVGPVHVRAGQIQFERVAPLFLARGGELPASARARCRCPIPPSSTRRGCAPETLS